MCSSYDDYGFSQQCVGVDRELDANPLEARARKLDSKARSAESAIDVSREGLGRGRGWGGGGGGVAQLMMLFG